MQAKEHSGLTQKKKTTTENKFNYKANSLQWHKKLILCNFKMCVYCTKSQGSTVLKSMKEAYSSHEGTAHINFLEHLLL